MGGWPGGQEAEDRTEGRLRARPLLGFPGERQAGWGEHVRLAGFSDFAGLWVTGLS